MNRAIFLDRDGVINEVLSKRVKFVNRPEDFHLISGVGKAIKIINELNFDVFVVTNQGGIGLGYMKETVLKKVHHKMIEDLSVFEAKITDIAYCPHRPNEGCRCRKPKPTMITDLARKYNIDFSNSYMVGDRAPDIEAGSKAGTMTVLVGTRNETTNADFIFQDLYEFAMWLQKVEGRPH